MSMNDGHKLPPGIEVTVMLYLTSDAEGIDAKPSATYRGGVPSLADLPDDWREVMTRLTIGLSPLDAVASDWRFMTRDEMEKYKAENEE